MLPTASSASTTIGTCSIWILDGPFRCPIFTKSRAGKKKRIEREANTKGIFWRTVRKVSKVVPYEKKRKQELAVENIGWPLGRLRTFVKNGERNF